MATLPFLKQLDRWRRKIRQLVDPNAVRFFSGSSHPQLAADIAHYLHIPLEETHISRFSNDNLYIQLGASVRSRDVFIIQSLSPPVNDHLVELLMMLDIARGAAAHQIHAVIPYFSFARSDKKDAARISITARLVADLLQAAGATHVMTMTLHAPQVHGFFGVPTDPLSGRPVFQHYFQQRDLSGTVVVSPDMGHAQSAARFASALGGLPVAAGNKERISDTNVKINGIVGHYVGDCKQALVYDDEISTGGSIEEITRHLVEHNVSKIWVACTHGVFVRGGLERLTNIPQIKEIVTTNTVPRPPGTHPKLTTLSVAHVFGEAIRRNHLRKSIGKLFDP